MASDAEAGGLEGEARGHVERISLDDLYREDCCDCEKCEDNADILSEAWGEAHQELLLYGSAGEAMGRFHHAVASVYRVPLRYLFGTETKAFGGGEDEKAYCEAVGWRQEERLNFWQDSLVEMVLRCLRGQDGRRRMAAWRAMRGTRRPAFARCGK